METIIITQVLFHQIVAVLEKECNNLDGAKCVYDFLFLLDLQRFKDMTYKVILHINMIVIL